MKIELTQEIVQRFLDYNPETGKFIWKNRSGNMARLNGNPALACLHTDGHHVGWLFCNLLSAHRVAWMHYHGYWPDVIDHINGDRADDTIMNLRDTTVSINSRNAVWKQRESGLPTGIHLNNSGTWRVIIGGASTKSFKCFDEAVEWNNRIREELGYTGRT